MSNEKPRLTSEHEQIIEKKARIFFTSRAPVHIILKRRNPKTGKNNWERGIILQEPGDDALMLTYSAEGQRKHEGRTSDLYIYLEIEDIQEFIPQVVLG